MFLPLLIDKQHYRSDFAEKLSRLSFKHQELHDSNKGLDLIEKLQFHLINRQQYKIEHNGLDYWLRNYNGAYRPAQETRTVQEAR